MTKLANRINEKLIFLFSIFINKGFLKVLGFQYALYSDAPVL